MKVATIIKILELNEFEIKGSSYFPQFHSKFENEKEYIKYCINHTRYDRWWLNDDWWIDFRHNLDDGQLDNGILINVNPLSMEINYTTSQRNNYTIHYTNIKTIKELINEIANITGLRLYYK